MLTKTWDIYKPILQLSYSYSLLYLYGTLTYNYLKYVNDYLNVLNDTHAIFFMQISKLKRLCVAQIII